MDSARAITEQQLKKSKTMKNKNKAVPFEVIERFAKRNGISLADSVVIHESMLEYLDNAAATKNPVSPDRLQDEAWHSFMLHSLDYLNFCNERYGRFIHHIPTSMSRDIFSDKVQMLLNLKNKGELMTTNDCDSSCGKHLCSSDCTPPSGEPAQKTELLSFIGQR